MFLIKTIEFSRNIKLEGVSCLHLLKNALEIKPGESQGTALLPAVQPSLVTIYDGFDVEGTHLENVEFSLIDRSGNPFIFNGIQWIKADSEVFQDIKTIREGLPQWKTSLKFKILLKRLENKKTPRVLTVRVGYHVHEELIEYAMRFALPQFLEREAWITRVIVPNDDRLSLPIPDNISTDLIQEILVHSPEHILTQGTLDIPTNLIYLSTPLPLQALRVLFSIKPRANYAVKTFQITETPCILLRNEEAQDWKQPYSEEGITCRGGIVRLSSVAYIYNHIVRVFVLAQSIADAKIIATELIGAIKTIGHLYLEPFDLEIPLQIKSYIKEDVNADTKGNIVSVSFLIALIGIPEGGTADLN